MKKRNTVIFTEQGRDLFLSRANWLPFLSMALAGLGGSMLFDGGLKSVCLYATLGAVTMVYATSGLAYYERYFLRREARRRAARCRAKALSNAPEGQESSRSEGLD